MSDLISRGKLFNLLAPVQTLGEAYGIIQKIPTVDAVPVVRGEWIEENTRPRSGVFYCSSCHRTCYDLQPTRLKGWTKRCRYAFCPNCGADMRKDGDDGKTD